MTLHSPDEKLQAIIQKANNEDIKTRDFDLEIIKTWMKQQPHLPDTWSLLNFLRGCNFSLEKTKKKIDMYFTMRAIWPELFSDRSVTNPDMAEFLKLINTGAISDLTPDGRCIVIGRAICETDSTNFVSLCKCFTMFADIRLIAEKYGTSGVIAICDAKIPWYKNFLLTPPTLLKKSVVFHRIYPFKIEEFHVVNVNMYAFLIYKALKPFIKEKLRKRIHFHEKLETLYNFVPKEMLPEEYGGSGRSMSELHENLMEKFKEFGKWFKEQEEVKADLSKKGEDEINCDYFFGVGVNGSFKQLNID